jgi:hypothetical protein
MTNSRPARHPAALMMLLRTWHTYVGLLIAPTVIFMAATGVTQIYNLHEAHGDYTPPPLLEKLSRVHKDQVFAPDGHGPPQAKPPATHSEPSEPPHEHAPKLATVLLKAFLTAVAVGLIGSASVGVWMALTLARGKRLLYGGLLLAGTAIPIVLAALSG